MTITITRNHQPYTVETWVIESHSPIIATDSDSDWIKALAAAGWIHVKGRILNSTTTSRLFHASVSRTVDEKPLDDVLPPEYLVDGATYVTVAM